jgi:hypothetical protein
MSNQPNPQKAIYLSRSQKRLPGNGRQANQPARSNQWVPHQSDMALDCLGRRCARAARERQARKLEVVSDPPRPLLNLSRFFLKRSVFHVYQWIARLRQSLALFLLNLIYRLLFSRWVRGLHRASRRVRRRLQRPDRSLPPGRQRMFCAGPPGWVYRPLSALPLP